MWGVVDKPVIGYYDSMDPGVVERQLYLIKRAGVDRLFISWWGPGSFEDKAAELVFDVAARRGLRAAILVEPYLGGDPNEYGPVWWRTILDYIRADFIERYPDVYMKLDGKPLVPAFNPIGEAYKPNPPGYTIRIVGLAMASARGMNGRIGIFGPTTTHSPRENSESGWTAT